MPDVLIWLGITRIDWLLSMSSEKYDAIRAAGIEVMQRISIPDDLVPESAQVLPHRIFHAHYIFIGVQIEIMAKVSAGYHTDMISKVDISAEIHTLESVRERCQRVFELGLRGQLVHFSLDLGMGRYTITASLVILVLGALPKAVDAVMSSIMDQYPKLDIPCHGRMRHFVID